MGKTQKLSVGLFLLQVALALYLAVTGLGLLGVGGSIKASQASTAVYALFSGDIARIVVIALGVVLVLSGAVLVLRIFVHLGTFELVLTCISLIAWIVIAAIIDICNFSTFSTILEWLLDLSKNLLIIGGLLAVIR